MKLGENDLKKNKKQQEKNPKNPPDSWLLKNLEWQIEQEI